MKAENIKKVVKETVGKLVERDAEINPVDQITEAVVLFLAAVPSVKGMNETLSVEIPSKESK